MGTKIAGKDMVAILGAVTVAATDLISISYFFEGKKVNSEGAGDDWETFLTDLTKAGGFTINGYDSGITTAETTSLRKGVEDIWSQDDHQDTVTIQVAGTATTRRQVSGTAILDRWEPTADKAATGLLTASFTWNGAVSLANQ